MEILELSNLCLLKIHFSQTLLGVSKLTCLCYKIWKINAYKNVSQTNAKAKCNCSSQNVVLHAKLFLKFYHLKLL